MCFGIRVIIQMEMVVIVIVIVTGSTSRATRKNNKVVCVSNLFSADIQLVLFQLVVNSLAPIVLHVFLMKYQMISVMIRSVPWGMMPILTLIVLI